MAEMDKTRLASIVAALVKDSEKFREDRSADRQRAVEYYDGTMSDIPHVQGRSAVVTRDVRSSIKKVLPSITRTILGNDTVVRYEPVNQDDEESSKQATDYINLIVFPESGGYAVVRNAIFDALLNKNGVIKWWCEEKTDIKASYHTGLDDMEHSVLVGEKDVTVLEHTERQENIGEQIVTVHDVRIIRRVTEKQIKLAAIPPEEFLVHPDALTLDASPIVGECVKLRRTDLVAMGYDKGLVWSFAKASSNDAEGMAEKESRRNTVDEQDELEIALEEVDFYDLCVRVDFDGDGIAELRRVVFAGGLGEKNLLENEYWDEVNYADIIAEARPHQREGQSVAEDLIPIQRIKTVLLRQTMDNLYWQNMPQPIVQDDMIINAEAVLNPSFGKPIRVKAGVNVNDAIGYNRVPFMADKSYAMMEYLDGQASDTTGINDASSGLAPDALQNMTAKATALLEQGGIGQIELMVRTIAEGLKRVFRGLLRLTIQHQDKPRMVKLRNQWVTFDPRAWNAGMDATVNTGLGAGTRERDMMVMGQVIGLQEKAFAAFGPDNPFVKPDNFYNAAAKMLEAAGLRSAEPYLTQPDPQEVAAQLEKLRNKPNPEQMKIQAQMQLEQAKMTANRDKEMAQMQADAHIKNIELEKESIGRREQLEADATREAMKIEFEREKLSSTERLKMYELQQQRDLKILEMNAAAMAKSTGEDESVQIGEDGAVSKQSLLADAIGNLSMLIQQMAVQSNQPKRIVRDPMTNEVIGFESIQPEVMS